MASMTAARGASSRGHPAIRSRDMPANAAALDAHFLLAATRRLHESIRARVSALLQRARAEARPELASRPGAWGAGDIAYGIDEAADAALEGFAAEIGARHPFTLVAEGPGLTRHGEHA